MLWFQRKWTPADSVRWGAFPSMEERGLAITQWVSVKDVMRALSCPRSTAYLHLRRASGRKPGERGLLRVPLEIWERYAQEEFQCQGSTNAGRSGGRGSMMARGDGSGRRRTARTRTRRRASPSSEKCEEPIRVTRPGTKRPSKMPADSS